MAVEHLEPTTLDTALAYAARGWRVLPITPGKKHPPISAWQDAATTDPTIITAWFTGLYRGHGIGIATGHKSGIWVLDVDDHDVLTDIETAHGVLPETLTSLTGSGGHHYLFAYPTDGTIITNANQLPQGIDTRGDGGQIVAPPTVHPNGQRYEWDAGTEHLEPAQAPAWLLDLVTAPARTERPHTTRTSTGDGRPGDRWAEAVDWADILTTDGWTLSHTDRKGIRYWVRPGKEVREGHSATTGWSSADNMNLFTSSLSHWGLNEGTTYSKLGYLATVHFDSDMAAAASWLRTNGYGDEDANLDDLIAHTTPLQGLPPAPPADEPEWPEPTLPADQATPPPFPLRSLPEWAQMHAVAVADQVQVPVDLAGMLIIGALSAACTGRASVAVSPNWIEPVNLYLVTAMRSGSGKSAAEKLCCQWLRDWQTERLDAAMPAWEEARQRLRLAERHLKKAEDGVNLDNEAIVALAARNDARDAVPELPRVLADDATPEAVANLLAAHGERIAVLSTEADLFDMVLKGKPGQRASMNVYLKAWSGDSLIRDRKGGTESGPEATMLKRPLMTVSITVQPSVLAKVNGDEEMVSRGFAARFMFALPQDLIGQRDQSRRFSAAKLASAQPFETQATTLADRWASWNVNALVHLGPDAAAMLEAFLVEVEPLLAPGQQYERLAEWVNKLHGSIARYAGLLHLAEDHSPSVQVDAETMARAIELGRYWLQTAVIVLAMADSPIEQAEAILEFLVNDGRQQFKLRDIQQGVRRPGIGLDKATDYVPAIELLVEHGWLRPSIPDWQESIGVKRRDSGNFSLWPKAAGQPQRVVYARKARSASMGERVLSLSPSTPTGTDHTPSMHAPRALRAYPEETPKSANDPTPDFTDIF